MLRRSAKAKRRKWFIKIDGKTAALSLAAGTARKRYDSAKLSGAEETEVRRSAGTFDRITSTASTPGNHRIRTEARTHWRYGCVHSPSSAEGVFFPHWYYPTPLGYMSSKNGTRAPGAAPQQQRRRGENGPGNRECNFVLADANGHELDVLTHETGRTGHSHLRSRMPARAPDWNWKGLDRWLSCGLYRRRVAGEIPLGFTRSTTTDRDMKALSERFGIPLPEEFRRFFRCALGHPG